MKILKIKLTDDIDVEHLIGNLIALADYSGNLTDSEKDAIKKACKKESLTSAVKNIRHKLDFYDLYHTGDEVDEVLTQLENKIKKL